MSTSLPLRNLVCSNSTIKNETGCFELYGSNGRINKISSIFDFKEIAGRHVLPTKSFEKGVSSNKIIFGNNFQCKDGVFIFPLYPYNEKAKC